MNIPKLVPGWTYYTTHCWFEVFVKSLLILGYLLQPDILAAGEVQLPSVCIFLTPPQDVAKWAPQGHPHCQPHSSTQVLTAALPRSPAGAEAGMGLWLMSACPLALQKRESRNRLEGLWVSGKSTVSGMWALWVQASFCRHSLLSINECGLFPLQGSMAQGVGGSEWGGGALADVLQVYSFLWCARS